MTREKGPPNEKKERASPFKEDTTSKPAEGDPLAMPKRRRPRHGEKGENLPMARRTLPRNQERETFSP